MSGAPNPFQSPTAQTVDQGVRSALGGAGKFDIGRCVSEGWQLTISNFGLILGALIVAGLVNIIACITIIGILLVVPVMLWGTMKLMLNVYDKRAQFGDIFSGFSKYGAALVPIMVIFLVNFLIGIPPGIIQGIGARLHSGVLSGLGSLLSLVVMIVAGIRFAFATYYVVDSDQGGIDAMKASWGATQDQKLNVFLLFLVSVAIIIAGCIPLGLGLLLAGPMVGMMWVSAFRQMVGSR
jgi:uncharacterized membrane protein